MIEFKYERTPENTARQLAGELRGLRPLNQSILIPTVKDDKITVHVKRLSPVFFKPSDSSRFNPVDVTSRDEAFKALQETFSQTDVWVKVDIDGNEIKGIIRPDTEINRVGEEDKLIIEFSMEQQ